MPIISTTVNILYDEARIKKAVDKENLGINVGECIHPMRFADDIAMPSNTAKGYRSCYQN